MKLAVSYRMKTLSSSHPKEEHIQCSFILERWIPLQQHRWLCLLSTFLILTMVGCGTNDNAAQKGDNDGTLPIGYYSNEKHDRKGGNVTFLEGDNDGPVIEIMDHTFGEEAKYERNNITPGEKLIGRDDRNYHGHLAPNMQPKAINDSSQINMNESDKLNNVVEKVNNVKEANTVVYNDNVVIGARLNKDNGVEETKKQILQAVNPYLDGRNVKLFTNESQYNRIKVISNDIRNKGSIDQQKQDLENLLNTRQNID